MKRTLKYLFLAITCLAIIGCGSSNTPSNKQDKPKVIGESNKDLVEETLKSKFDPEKIGEVPYLLDKIKYEPISNSITFYMATWCPHCVDFIDTELPKLNGRVEYKLIFTVKNQKGEDITQEVKDFVKYRGIYMYSYIDDKDAVAKAYNITMYPSMIVKKNNKLKTEITHYNSVDEILNDLEIR